MMWNRADIAQEEILREDVVWKEGELPVEIHSINDKKTELV